MLELIQEFNSRTYTAEPQLTHNRNWTNKPPNYQQVVYANRRRNKRLQRCSELCERSFAHLCGSSGIRRSWLRRLENFPNATCSPRLFGQRTPVAPQSFCTCALLPVSCHVTTQCRVTTHKTETQARGEFQRLLRVIQAGDRAISYRQSYRLELANGYHSPPHCRMRPGVIPPQNDSALIHP